MPHDGRGSPTQPRGLRGVFLAIFFVAAAFALTIALRQLSARAYFILFVPAVMFSSWFGGRASGLIASALSVLATFFLVPRAEVGIEFSWLVVAALVTVGISVLTDLRRRAEGQLTARADEESSRRRDAEYLSQLKTDVLVQVAHELRQPLSAIIASAAHDGGSHTRAPDPVEFTVERCQVHARRRNKGLAELPGGFVEARSEGVGQGSEFVVNLPNGGDADQC